MLAQMFSSEARAWRVDEVHAAAAKVGPSRRVRI